MDFSTVRGMAQPEGEVKRIIYNNHILWEKPVLHIPNEYQRVEYIGTSGSQGIIYKESYAETSEVIMTCLIPQASEGHGYLMGGYNRETSPKGYLSSLIWNSTRKVESYSFTSASVSSVPLSLNTVYKISVKFEMKKLLQTQQIFQDDQLVSIRTGTPSAPPSGIQLTNFGIGHNGYLLPLSEYANRGFVGNIYAFQHKCNGIIVRNFVPCYRKSDGEIGMYDLISQTFFTNKGTGSFTKGPDITFTNIIDTVGYMDNIRVSGSGKCLEPCTGITTTGIINISNFTDLVTLRASGLNFLGGDSRDYILLYDEVGTQLAHISLDSFAADGTMFGVPWNNLSISVDENSNVIIQTMSLDGAKYFRLTGHGSGADLIVTINEPIVV